MVTGRDRVPWCTTKEMLGGGYDNFQGKGKESCIEMMYSSDYVRMLPITLMGKGADQSRCSVSCLCYERVGIGLAP